MLITYRLLFLKEHKTKYVGINHSKLHIVTKQIKWYPFEMKKECT